MDLGGCTVVRLPSALHEVVDNPSPFAGPVVHEVWLRVAVGQRVISEGSVVLPVDLPSASCTARSFV
jgi:hypothetical protein